VLCCAKEGEVKRKRALCMGSLQGQAGAANANVSCAIFFFSHLIPISQGSAPDNRRVPLLLCCRNCRGIYYRVGALQ